MPVRNILTNRAHWAYAHDLVMTGVAFLAAVYLRVGDQLFTYYFHAALMSLPVIVGLAAVIYRVVGLYRGIWRYASVNDLNQLIRAVTLVVAGSLLLLFLINRLDPIPRSVPIIQWFVTIAFLGGPRFVYRLLKDRRIARAMLTGDEPRTPILLVGANDVADLFLRSLANDRASPYRAVGVISTTRKRVGRAMHGVPVLAAFDGLERAIQDLKAAGNAPHRVVLTQDGGEADGATVRALVEICDRLGLPVSRLPRMTDFKAAVNPGRVELQPIAIEDLLGRPQAALDLTAIRRLAADRVVLVTGAGGTIGGELSRQIAGLAPQRLVLLDSGEFNLYTIEMELRQAHPGLTLIPVLCDVRDRQRVARVFAEHRPELVFHAAALKHVPMVEANPCEGVLTNVIGTRNVADAAAETGTVAMVLISTDKAIRPTSVMGATKRIAETYCQALDMEAVGHDGTGLGGTRFMTVRFGNVLGSSGSVVPLFQRQLAKGGPLTVTHPEMKRYFMTVREAVELVLQASAYGLERPQARGKIFVLDMGEPVKIVDLARQMIRLSGLRPDIDVEIAFTGLRPGEKLFEELLDPAEAPSRTEADGVFIAAPRIVDLNLLTRMIRELEAAAAGGDNAKVLAIHRTIVPDYGAEASPGTRVAAASG